MKKTAEARIVLETAETIREARSSPVFLYYEVQSKVGEW